MGWRTTDLWFDSHEGQQIFLFLKNVHIASGVHQISYSMGTGVVCFLLGYSPPSESEIQGTGVLSWG